MASVDQMMAEYETMKSQGTSTHVSLPPDQETQFQEWYKGWAKKGGIDPNPDNPEHHYDYRAAFKAGATPTPYAPDNNRLHWPSEFKDGDHPNRFVAVNGKLLDTKLDGPPAVQDMEADYQRLKLTGKVVPAPEPKPTDASSSVLDQVGSILNAGQEVQKPVNPVAIPNIPGSENNPNLASGAGEAINKLLLPKELTHPVDATNRDAYRVKLPDWVQNSLNEISQLPGALVGGLTDMLMQPVPAIKSAGHLLNLIPQAAGIDLSKGHIPLGSDPVAIAQAIIADSNTPEDMAKAQAEWKDDPLSPFINVAMLVLAGKGAIEGVKGLTPEAISKAVEEAKNKPTPEAAQAENVAQQAAGAASEVAQKPAMSLVPDPVITQEVPNAGPGPGGLQDQVGVGQVAPESVPQPVAGVGENRPTQEVQAQGQVGAEVPVGVKAGPEPATPTASPETATANAPALAKIKADGKKTANQLTPAERSALETRIAKMKPGDEGYFVPRIDGEVRMKTLGMEPVEGKLNSWRKVVEPAPAAATTQGFGKGKITERAAGLTPEAVNKSLEAINKSGAMEDVRKVIIPASRGEAASKMAGLVREGAATLALRDQRAQKSLSGARKFFSSVPKEDAYDFIDRVEHGSSQKDANLDGVARTWREISDADRKAVQDLGTGKLQSFYEDYFPHMWKDPSKAAEFIGQILGRKPLEGSRAFLKKRTIEFFSDGIKAGLEPISENPVDLMLLKHHEIQKYVMAHTVMKEAKKLGLVEFVSSFEKPPQGLTKVDDRISTVYGPSSIPMKEYVDKSVYDGLSKVAEELGIQHERKMRVGHQALGISHQRADLIQTQYATETSVLAHEIGHQLDYKYHLWDNLLKKQNGEGFAKGRSELRALADLTGRGKTARTRPEKMAQMLEGYIHSPEKMKEAAPRVYDWFDKFLASHTELAPLREIKPGLKLTQLNNLQPTGGMVITGNWYMPEEASRIINNYLSPGLSGRSAIFRGYRGASNWLNQFQLGFSAFHLGFTSFEASVSSFENGLYKAAHGNFLGGVRDIGLTPVAPVTTIWQGRRLYRAAFAEYGSDPVMQPILDALTAGGGRLKMDDFYRTNITQKMTDAFKKHNYIGAVVRVPFSVTELAMKPILDYVVPRQKLGVFANMMKYELERNPNMDAVELRRVAGKCWDSVDNRLGQLVYDNLFWNKTFKDLSMASVRSLGWNLGTIRELGGGLMDFAKAGYDLTQFKGPEFSHRMGYVVALPVVAGLYGALTQYLFTGKGPSELKDYYYPKTGNTDEKGDPERVVLPTYMKDIYHYINQPGRTLRNKIHPMLSMMAEMFANEDFYGTKIRNEDDPVMKQVLDVAEYGGRTLTPFAVRGLQQNLKSGEGLAKAALPFVGITPAPADIKKTEAEKKLSEIMAAIRFAGSSIARPAVFARQAKRSRFRRGCWKLISQNELLNFLALELAACQQRAR